VTWEAAIPGTASAAKAKMRFIVRLGRTPAIKICFR
jgi:hypothetical protein